jgi:hypothetical protein
VAKSHKLLREKMTQAGYTPNEKGVCLGVSCMAIQSMLTDKLTYFDKMIAYTLKSDDEEHLKSDVTKFLGGIQNYQSIKRRVTNPLTRPQSFSSFNRYKSSIFATNTHTPSIKHHPIVNIATIELKHTPNHIENFFTSFRHAHAEITHYPPIALLITSRKHAIAVFFDYAKKLWKIVNANSLPTRTFNSELMLTKKVMRAFSHSKIDPESKILKIRFFTTPEDQALATFAISLLGNDNALTISKHKQC